MAFKKTGDNESISAFFDDDKVITCDKCGKVVTTILITADENEPICACEDKDADE